MDSYTRLLNILKSNSCKSFISNAFNEYKEKLNKSIKEEEFEKFIKAFVLDMYSAVDDSNRTSFVDRIEYAFLGQTELEYFVLRLNACLSKPNDHINKDSEEFFAELEPYKDKPISKMLSQYRKEIFKTLSEEMGVFTIDQIKNEDYHIPERDSEGRMGEYFLDEDEIEIIEKAHKASVLVDIGHSLYDDFKYVPRPTIFGNIEVDRKIVCDYEKADNDGLGNIVFNTLKDSPKLEVDIVFEDGIIMQYHKGSIRKEPYTIDEMMTYIYDYATKILEELGFNENNISSIEPKELSSIILEACIEISAQSDYLGEIYSKKMIDSSKKYVKRLVRIAKEENL